MLHSSHYLIDRLLITFILWIFIVAGFAGVVLGVGLNVSSARTLRFLGAMNRWISLRKNLKSLEQPHDIGKAVHEHRRWFGAAFAIGGAFVVFMLLTQIDVAAVVLALGLNTAPNLVDACVRSLKWILVTGGVLALIVGVMLAVSSHALPTLEAVMNRWYSPRQLGKGADTMHLTLDQWVEAFPRTTGAMMGLSAAIVLIGSLIVWLGK